MHNIESTGAERSLRLADRIGQVNASLKEINEM